MKNIESGCILLLYLPVHCLSYFPQSSHIEVAVVGFSASMEMIACGSVQKRPVFKSQSVFSALINLEILERGDFTPSQSLPTPHGSDRACLERTQRIMPESESVWQMADGS